MLPSRVLADVTLEGAVDAAELGKAPQKMRGESQIGEHAVDEGKDVEPEVHGQLPGVLEGKRLLVAERVVAHGKPGDVAFVERAHHLLVESGLAAQILVVFGEHRVDDQDVVEGDEIAAGAVERIGEAAGLH